MSILKVPNGFIIPQYCSKRKYGELYEDLFVINLLSFGIVAYRPKQNFHAPEDKKRVLHGLKPMHEVKPSIYTKQQRDVLIKVPDSIKRICIEVKSRNNPFKYDDVLSGRVSTWDIKQFDVHYLAVIDQITKECRVTVADAETRKTRWLVRNEHWFEDRCYSIPLDYLIPLDEWVQQNSYLIQSNTLLKVS